MGSKSHTQRLEELLHKQIGYNNLSDIRKRGLSNSDAYHVTVEAGSINLGDLPNFVKNVRVTVTPEWTRLHIYYEN